MKYELITEFITEKKVNRISTECILFKKEKFNREKFIESHNDALKKFYKKYVK